MKKRGGGDWPLTGLLGAVCLFLFAATGSAADWTFARGSLAGGLLQSKTRGPGRVQGSARLASKPDRLELDGQSFVVLSDNVSDYGLASDALTVETWVRVDRSAKWCGFLSAIQDNGSFERGWMLGFRDGRFCFGLVSDKRQRITYLSASQPIALGAWYHVAGVWNGQTMRLYVDGKLAAQSEEQQGRIVYAPKGVVALGAYVDDNETYSLQGALAAASIIDKALPGDAIAKRFASQRQTYPQVDAEEPRIVGWPTYLHDDARSGATEEQLQLPLALHWVYRPQHQPSPAWPPPAKQDFWHGKKDLRPRVAFDRAFHVVSDGRRAYFGSSSDDQLRAIDLRSGRLAWSHFADGPIRLAPTIANEKVYYGSDDGAVRCLDAKTGNLIWRFEVTERPRVIPGNGRLISVFPVRTGVIVKDSVARFGAGLFPAQGAHQFAVDAATGKLLAKGKLSFSPQGYMQRVGNSLQVSQGRAPAKPVAQLENIARKPAVMRGLDAAREGYPHAWIRANDLHFGGGDGKVAAFQGKSSSPIWTTAVEGQAHSLAVAGGSLLVSTSKGVVYCFRPVANERQPTTTDEAATAARNRRDDRVPRALETTTQQIAGRLDAAAGYGLILGGDASFAWSLAQRTPLRLVVVQSNAKQAEAMRRQLRDVGAYGSVTVRVAAKQLPFARKVFNLVVLAEGESRWKAEAVAPLVRPAGGVLVDLTGRDEAPADKRRRLADWRRTVNQRWELIADGLGESPLTLQRRPLEGAGEWTHMYGNASNSACSNDQRVKGELDLQWFGEPGPREMMDRHHRATPPLYSAGTLYIPGNETVYGLDAYNGAVLWQTSLANFRRVGAPRDGGNMAATADTLYAVAKDRCYALSAKDGAQRAAFAPPALADKSPREWGFVAVVDQALFGSTTQPGASRSDHSRQQISQTYYDFVPIVTSDSIFRLDRQSGETAWSHQARGAVLNPTITLGSQRVFFVESRNPETLDDSQGGRIKLSDFFRDGADLVALDQTTGKQIWRKEVDFSRVQHHLYLAFAKNRLVAVGTRNEKQGKRNTVRYDLTVFDAGEGKTLWTATQDQAEAAGGSHGEQDHHPAIVGDLILQEPYAYDLHTGKRRKDWRFARQGHGCGTVSASASAFFFRAGNPTMCDLTTGQKQKINAVSRPGCWINIIPAGGMLLIPEASSGCTCNFPIQSSMAFAPRESSP